MCVFSPKIMGNQMGSTVTRTKILVPRRREDLLSRPRLLHILDDILDYPFTLISAPAGYGKTSLLIDLVQQAEYPVCWYSLDKLDQDPQRFLDHLIGCVQIRFPGFGETSARLVKDLPNPLDPSDQLITTLVNELYEKISEHIVIILDDFHLVAENLQISSFVSKFGQMADDNIHLVMTSRNLFDFPDIPLLTGRRKIKGIGYDDLAFNEEEIKTLFSDVYKQVLTPEQAKQIAADTEGWITGLMLSGKHIKDYFPDQIKAALVTGADIFNYLAEQVFQKQTTEIKEFLLQSSIFDEFSQQLCSAVLGWPEEKEWDRLVQHLVQQNLFIQQVNDNELWIRYHHLFLDYLRDSLKKSEPDQEKMLLTRLASVYTQSSKWEKAFETAQRLGDANALAQVIDKASSDLFHSGRIQLLSTWLSYLPEEIYDEFPKLEILIGISNTTLGKPILGLQQLTKTIGHPGTNTEPLILTRAHLCRATTNRLLGNYKEALEDIKSIHKLTLTNNISRQIIAESHREAGLLHNYLSNNVLSIEYLTKSLKIYKSIDDQKNSSLVHSDLGLVYMDLGDFETAEYHLLLAKDIWITLNNANQLSVVYNNIGNLKISKGKYTEAHFNLSLGMEYAKASVNLRMEAYILASLGDIAFSLSSYAASYNLYQKANKISRMIQEGYLLSFLNIRLSSLARISNRITRNKGTIREFHNSYKANNSRLELGIWHLENGLLQTKVSSYLLGRTSFRRAFNIFKKISKPLEMANVQAGQALLELSAGKSTAALKYLQSASATIQEIGSNQPLLPMLSRHYDEFAKILYSTDDADLINLRTDLTDFRNRLPRMQREIFPEQTKQLQSKPALQIQAFGKTQLWVKGEKLSVSEWVHQKTVRELFYYLLTRTEGVNKEEVGLVFWPDSSPRQLNKQFKNVIYRLRRSIGKNRILYDAPSRSYTFNANLEYTYDVEDFLSYLEDAKRETHPESRLKYLQQAIKLYRHPFVSNLDGVWAEPIRRVMYLHYEKAVLDLAEYQYNIGNFDDCLILCQELIKVEPCQEEAYQLCMLSYVSLGDSKGVHRNFHLCRKNLERLLNISPSPKTKSILKSI